MDETETLSIASRIKRPIPLAALAILVLVVVALAVIQSGAAQMGAIAYVIIGVVAVVALVTLILALVLGKPAHVSITTQGDYSPGDVSGNYTVSRGATLPQPQRPPNSYVSNPSPLSSSTSIETKGGHSPGRVGGDYDVQEE